jgi:hypothetical protein
MLAFLNHPKREVAMRFLSLLLVLPAFEATAQAYGPDEIVDWETQRFEGRTEYAWVPADAAGAPHAAVRATCRDATASGRVVRDSVVLSDTPVLEWRWRVDSSYSGLDETTKAGDDYAARVYVVAERWPRFRSRAINYVWAGSQPRGSTWENAFASQFMMVAVRSGDERVGEWLTERRDVREDFRNLHDIEPDTIDALAIMTDCDNAGQRTTAWYGPIRWLPAGR